MSSQHLLSNRLRKWVPWWLSDRHYSSGKSVGFRFLWVLVVNLDIYLEYMVQALIARFPGVGTPTALPYIGRSRGILRGQADTDATYAAKLVNWLTKWAGAGSQTQLAIEIHEYLGNSPMVRVFNRAGTVVAVASNGTVTKTTCVWNWDGTSNPERSGYWSELWIVVYPTQWALESNWGIGTWGQDAGGFGHAASRVENDAIRGLVAQWKAAHSLVRAIIWSSDGTLFDPATPASLPDGKWGQWSTVAGGYVPSDRNLISCRYWEF